MQERSDAQLLCAFAGRADEVAFREIVARYTDLVYSAAVRQVESSAAASDIAQSVFTDLARKAGTLARDGGTALPPSLAGWLHRATRYAALNHLRDTRRRLTNERQAMEQLLTDSESGADWEQIRPVLDEALDSLSDEDREVLLLRYFKNQGFRAVGQALGVSDDAAQKRVSRAVERLREFFSKRKVTIGASGLGALISANAVQSAPVGLAIAISTAALAGTAITTSTAITVTKTIAMTTLQKALITVTVAALAGAGIYEARQIARLREQNEALRQQQTPLAAQLQQLQDERDKAASRLAELLARSQKTGSDSNELELLKLRGELAAMKNATDDPTEKTMKDVTAGIKSLKQLLEQRPERKIPELRFLTDKDWAEAAWNADLSTEDGIRVALSNLRGDAENTFLNEMMKAAMKKYLAANGNVLPSNLTQLEPYFDVPVTDDMLQRYQLMQTGTPDNSAELVKLAVYNDEDYDSNHGMSINGAWGGGFNHVQDAIYSAIMDYTLANYGQTPTDPSQVTSYLKRTVDPATVQKYFGQITADMTANPPSPDLVTLFPAIKAYQAANNGQVPNNPSGLQPYLTTQDQQAALQRVEKQFPGSK